MRRQNTATQPLSSIVTEQHWLELGPASTSWFDDLSEQHAQGRSAATAARLKQRDDESVHVRTGDTATDCVRSIGPASLGGGCHGIGDVIARDNCDVITAKEDTQDDDRTEGHLHGNHNIQAGYVHGNQDDQAGYQHSNRDIQEEHHHGNQDYPAGNHHSNQDIQAGHHHGNPVPASWPDTPSRHTAGMLSPSLPSPIVPLKIRDLRRTSTPFVRNGKVSASPDGSPNCKSPQVAPLHSQSSSSAPVGIGAKHSGRSTLKKFWLRKYQQGSQSSEVVLSPEAELNQSSISWTSSLATPPTANHSFVSTCGEGSESPRPVYDTPRHLTAGAARMLFTPCGPSQESEQFDVGLNSTIEQAQESLGWDHDLGMSDLDVRQELWATGVETGRSPSTPQCDQVGSTSNFFSQASFDLIDSQSEERVWSQKEPTQAVDEATQLSTGYSVHGDGCEEDVTMVTEDLVAPAVAMVTKESMSHDGPATMVTKDQVSCDPAPTMVTKDQASHDPAATMVTDNSVSHDPPATMTTKDSVSHDSVITVVTKNLSHDSVTMVTEEPPNSQSKRSQSHSQKREANNHSSQKNCNNTSMSSPPSFSTVDEAMSFMLQSPPKRSSLRKAVTRKLTGNPKSQDELPSGGKRARIPPSQSETGGVAEALPDCSAADDQKRPTPKLTVKIPNVIQDQDPAKAEGAAEQATSPTLFSQVSPDVLRALCQAADLSPVEPPSPGSTLKSGHEADLKSTPPRLIEQQADDSNQGDDVFFSQLSPTAMEAIMKATETPGSKGALNGDCNHGNTGCVRDGPMGGAAPKDETAAVAVASVEQHVEAQTPHVGVLSPRVGLQSPHIGVQSPHVRVQSPHVRVQSPHVRVQSPRVGVQSPRVGVQSPRVGVQSPQAGPQRKPLSLKTKRSKKFFYPTGNQITSECPRQVFNFEAEKKFKPLASPTPASTLANKCENKELKPSCIEKDPIKNEPVASPAKVTEVKPQGVASGSISLSLSSDVGSAAERSRSTPKPYWKRQSAGFTNLSSYNKSCNTKPELTTTSNLCYTPPSHRSLDALKPTSQSAGTPVQNSMMNTLNSGRDAGPPGVSKLFQGSAVASISTEPRSSAEVVPHVATSEVVPRVATSEVVPHVATSELVPRIATSKVAPHVATSEVVPLVATSEVVPRVATSEVEPRVATSEVVPQTAPHDLNTFCEVKKVEHGDPSTAPPSGEGCASGRLATDSMDMANPQAVVVESLSGIEEGAVKHSTAEGGDIMASKNSIAEIPSVVQPNVIDTRDARMSESKSVGSFVGFQCASGRAIALTESGLRKARLLTEEVDREFSEEQARFAEGSNAGGAKVPVRGFQSARFQSASASEFMQKMPAGGFQSASASEVTQKMPAGGFQSASDSEVVQKLQAGGVQSSNASEVTQKMPDGGGFQSATFQSASTSEVTQKMPDGRGFQSASGKSIKLNTDVLQRYSKWLNDDNGAEDWIALACARPTEDPRLETSHPSGATIASGSAAKTQKMPAGGFQSTSFQSARASEVTQKIPAGGFQSASASEVTQKIPAGGFQSSSTSEATPTVSHASVKVNVPAPQRDWSKVPKGFRPFKPPRITPRTPSFKQGTETCKEERVSEAGHGMEAGHVSAPSIAMETASTVAMATNSASGVTMAAASVSCPVMAAASATNITMSTANMLQCGEPVPEYVEAAKGPDGEKAPLPEPPSDCFDDSLDEMSCTQLRDFTDSAVALLEKQEAGNHGNTHVAMETEDQEQPPGGSSVPTVTSCTFQRVGNSELTREQAQSMRCDADQDVPDAHTAETVLPGQKPLAIAPDSLHAEIAASLSEMVQSQSQDCRADPVTSSPLPVSDAMGRTSSSLQPPTARQFAGFQTASGREVQVSEGALNKARALWEETDSNWGTGARETIDDSVNPGDLRQDHPAVESSSGQGIGAQQVKVSHDTRGLLEEWDTDVPEGLIPGDLTSQTSSPAALKMQQFTAAGSAIVSPRTLKGAKDLLQFVSEDNWDASQRGSVSSSHRDVAQVAKDLCVSSSASDDPCCASMSKTGDHLPQCRDPANQAREEGRSTSCEVTAAAREELLAEDVGKLPAFAGFQTAGGTVVSVSPKALARAKSLLSEGDENSEEMTAQSIAATETKTSPKNSTTGKTFDHTRLGENKFGGFQTAGGRQVTVSETSLAKVKTLFDDPVTPSAMDCDVLDQDQLAPMTFGFQTAAGKAVTVSETSLAKVKTLFEDPVTSFGQDLDAIRHDCKDLGFQMAGGSAVAVSKSSFVKVKDPDMTTRRPSEANCRASGFETASGRHVTVSETSLAKVKSLFESPSGSVTVVEESKESLTDARNLLKGHSTDLEEGDGSGNHGFGGFQTASGQNVKISEEALQQARHSLIDGDGDAGVTMATKNGNHGFGGFQTASGQKVQISEEALQKARHSLIDGDGDAGVTMATKNGNHGFEGFQTAGGQKVKISEEALLQARHSLIDGDGDAGVTMATKNGNHGLGGFHTASGQKVNISEQALQQARHSLDVQDEATTIAMATKDGNHGFGGFQTASGQKVNISEEALKQARQFLPSQDDHDVTSANMVPMATAPVTPATASKDLISLGQSAVKITESALQQRNPNPNGEPIIGNVNNNIVKEEGNHNVTPATTSVAHELDGTFEAAEYTAALLADGEFDDDWDAEEGLSLKTSTPLESNRAVSRTLFGAPCGSQQAPKAWMKAVSTTPEESCEDRPITEKSTVIHPMRTAPEQSTLPGSSAPVPVRPPGPARLARCNDRSAFRTLCILPPASAGGVPITPKHPGISMATKTSSGSFVSPFKTTKPFELSPIAEVVTPKKESGPARGGFSTPYKQPSGSFRTPVKDPVANCVQPNDSCQIRTSEDGGCKPVEATAAESQPIRQGSSSVSMVTAEVAKKRMHARVAQAQRIRIKREKGDTKPQPGSLWRQRHGGQRVTLRQAVEGQLPRTCSQQELHANGVRQSTVNVTSASAENFRFAACEHIPQGAALTAEGVRLGDGAFIVLSEDSTLGKEEFCNGLLESEGVEPKLISRHWVYNHYRWIIWKLAAMETTFPAYFGGRCLTPDQVMLQLKYRYDREIDHSHRSALKKIYEHDDTPQKAMVLCVAGVIDLQSPTKLAGSNCEGQPQKSMKMLELTDGWYCIQASLDPPLCSLLAQGRIKVGDKLAVCGTELVGAQDGAPPLEAPAGVVLKICANSTRRARWDSRLGYCARPLPVPLSLTSLYPTGGQVGCVDVVVTRVYPLLYLEKSPEGSNTFRSERAEERAARTYERDRQRHLERLYSSIQAEMEKTNLGGGGAHKQPPSGARRQWSHLELTQLHSGAELYDAIQSASDPDSVESELSLEQRESLHSYRRRLVEQQQAELQAELQLRLQDQQQQACSRSVVPLLKVRVAGCNTRDVDAAVSTVLSIWRPAEDIYSVLAEGSRLHIYNTTAAETRGKSTSCPVSLTATRATQYRPVPVDDNFLDLVYQARELTHFSEFNPGFRPQHMEVDVVGVVVHVAPITAFERSGGGEGRVQTVYLADSGEDFLAVKFWGGVAAHCLEDALTPHSVLSLSNLQWTPTQRSAHHVPCVTASELSCCSRNPKQPQLRGQANRLTAHIKETPGFVERMQAVVEDCLGGGGYNHPKMFQSPGTEPPTPTRWSHSTPTAVLPSPVTRGDAPPPVTPVGRSLPAPQDMTTPVAGPTPTGVMSRRRSLLRAKVARLEQYGTPPPISPLCSPSLGAVRRAFKPPSLRGSPLVLTKAQPVSTPGVVQKDVACESRETAVMTEDGPSETAVSAGTRKENTPDNSGIVTTMQGDTHNITDLPVIDEPNHDDEHIKESSELLDGDSSDVVYVESKSSGDSSMSQRKRQKRGPVKRKFDPVDEVEEDSSGRKRRSLRLTRKTK